MFRRLHLLLAAFAMLIAPVAMQSGMAMAAMPMDHGAAAQTGHCGDVAPEDSGRTGAMTQCCIAMCAAIAPLDSFEVDAVAYHAEAIRVPTTTEHRAFLAKLPTPPPRIA